jgi:hypothetical protein
MKTVATATHLLIRVVGLALTVLGILMWTGNAWTWLPLYVAGGGLVALALWVLAYVGARSGANPGTVLSSVLLGIFVPAVGFTGDWRLCLLAGVSAIADAESMAVRARRLNVQTSQASRRSK